MLATLNDRQITDLVDFYRQWPEMRRQACALRDRGDVGEEDREILKWMIRVVDRVGPSDLNQEV